MCWLCDHPDATQEDYFDVLRAKVLQHGWVVQYVESVRTPFAYTIGLHDLGVPELLVTGVSTQRARRLLNGVAWHVLCDGPPAPGEQLPVPGGPLVEFVEVDHPDAHMGWAVAFGGPLRALQVVWADGRGRWPWAAAFCDGRTRQPVLGVRAQNA
jgi:hypothetical protein